MLVTGKYGNYSLEVYILILVLNSFKKEILFFNNTKYFII